MWNNYLKVALRNLWKNRLYVSINILGLGLGLACCIVAFLNWEYNAQFDSYHSDTDRVYRVNFIRNIDGQSYKNGSCPLPIAELAKSNIDQIEIAARYMPRGANFKVKDQIFRSGLSAVDPSFTKMFEFDLIEGDPSSLEDMRTIWIDQKTRQKYWTAGQDVIGEVITYLDGDLSVEFKVGGVFKTPPQNSSFLLETYVNYEALFSIEGKDLNNWAEFNSTFIRVSPESDLSTIENQLQSYIKPQNQAKDDYKVARYYLDPFRGMAVRAEKEGIYNHWFSQSLPTAAAVAPGVMAFLLLLISSFNYTNTSISTSNRRIKEIGIRKVLGSQKRQIMIQFFAENVLLTLLALVAGILMAAFLVPAYSAMWVFLDIRFTLFENIYLLFFLLILLVFTAFVAGSYPSLYVSNFRPASIFRRTTKFGGSNLLMRILLTFQFALALVAIICGFIFAQNAKFQEQYDMGFDLESVIYARVDNARGFRAFKNEVQGIPEISKISGARHNLTSSWYTDPIKTEGREIDAAFFDIGPDYLKAINAEILMGRDFIPASKHDIAKSIIINEELAKRLSWTDPIDKKLILKDTMSATVVGMVKDIYFQGDLFNPIEPMVLRLTDADHFRYLVVRTNTHSARKVKAQMDQKWKKVFPDKISTVEYMETDKIESAEVNANIRKLFVFLAAVAVILSAIGLFSLVSLNINKRLKEIGIRKILGASTPNIAVKISFEFIIILVTASVVGSVCGYYLARLLMNSIWAYYTPMKVEVFLLAIGVLVLVCLITISGKVLKTASTIPLTMLQE